jgi:hypothetical protein
MDERKALRQNAGTPLSTFSTLEATKLMTKRSETFWVSFLTLETTKIRMKLSSVYLFSE